MAVGGIGELSGFAGIGAEGIIGFGFGVSPALGRTDIVRRDSGRRSSRKHGIIERSSIRHDAIGFSAGVRGGGIGGIRFDHVRFHGLGRHDPGTTLRPLTCGRHGAIPGRTRRGIRR